MRFEQVQRFIRQVIDGDRMVHTGLNRAGMLRVDGDRMVHTGLNHYF